MPEKSNHKRAWQTAQKALQAAKNAEATALIPRRSTGSKTFSEWWKSFWSVVGAPFATISGILAILHWSPEITIEPGVNLDPAKEYSTKIMIANRGNVPVYELAFACGYGGMPRTVFKNVSSEIDIRPAAVLSAHSTITRGCALHGDIEGNTTMEVSVGYNWPLIGWRRIQRAVFRVEKGAPGYFLLPDGSP